MLARLRSYGEVLEVYHNSKLDLLRGFRVRPVSRTLWPPSAVGVDLMIRAIVAQLNALERRPDLVHAETSPMGYAALSYSRESGVPYILDLHGIWSAEHLGRVEATSKTTNQDRVPALRFLERLERDAARHANRLIVVSETMKSHAVVNWGVPASKVRVIPNGGFQSPRRARFSATPRLVYGGILAYWEKWHDFVEMSRYWDVAGSELLMLGGGPDIRILRRRLKVLRPRNLRYLGMRSRDETLELFLGSQIGVAPSSDDLTRRVAWPIKVMEYMSSGLPVIVPMVGDWGRMVKEHDAGVVTAHSDPREFCEAAKTLCEVDEWTRASKNAFDTIQSDFLWEHVLEPLDDVYL